MKDRPECDEMMIELNRDEFNQMKIECRKCLCVVSTEVGAYAAPVGSVLWTYCLAECDNKVTEVTQLVRIGARMFASNECDMTRIVNDWCHRMETDQSCDNGVRILAAIKAILVSYDPSFAIASAKLIVNVLLSVFGGTGCMFEYTRTNDPEVPVDLKIAVCGTLTTLFDRMGAATSEYTYIYQFIGTQRGDNDSDRAVEFHTCAKMMFYSESDDTISLSIFRDACKEFAENMSPHVHFHLLMAFVYSFYGAKSHLASKAKEFMDFALAIFVKAEDNIEVRSAALCLWCSICMLYDVEVAETVLIGIVKSIPLQRNTQSTLPILANFLFYIHVRSPTLVEPRMRELAAAVLSSNIATLGGIRPEALALCAAVGARIGDAEWIAMLSQDESALLRAAANIRQITGSIAP